MSNSLPIMSLDTITKLSASFTHCGTNTATGISEKMTSLCDTEIALRTPIALEMKPKIRLITWRSLTFLSSVVLCALLYREIFFPRISAVNNSRRSYTTDQLWSRPKNGILEEKWKKRAKRTASVLKSLERYWKAVQIRSLLVKMFEDFRELVEF